MEEKKYMIIENIDSPFKKIIAKGLDLDIAIMIIKGYTETYFNESLNLTIKEDKPEENNITPEDLFHGTGAFE